MADRQGGKQGDAGTKQDQPSDQQGKGTPAKEELETQVAAQEAAQQVEASEPSADPGRSGAAAEDAPAPKRTRGRKKAEDTAAEETGIDKDAAEVAPEEAKPKR